MPRILTASTAAAGARRRFLATALRAGRALPALLLAGLAAAPAAPALAADAYPSRPIRLVVPYPPGGATDIIARTLAPELSRLLGQPAVVENRGGGVSVIGTDIVARAEPDGYTLLMSDQALMTNPALQTHLPYDTLKDLAPVALIGPAPSVLLVHPSLPVHNIQELIALAKASPDTLQYASSGNGTSTHIAGEVLKQVAGIKMAHIPYRGAGPALTDVMGGHVPILVTSIGPALPMIQSGKLRPIDVSSTQRSPALPDVPSRAEEGLPEAVATGYWGVLAPAGVSDEVIGKLNGAFNQIIQLPEIREKLISLGVDPTGGSAQQFGDILNQEIPKMRQIITSAGITID